MFHEYMQKIFHTITFFEETAYFSTLKTMDTKMKLATRDNALLLSIKTSLRFIRYSKTQSKTIFSFKTPQRFRNYFIPKRVMRTINSIMIKFGEPIDHRKVGLENFINVMQM